MKIKKELDHFKIGNSYGGNQDWFRTFMMRIGGCGAETACDSSLYFALHKGVENIYPFDKERLTRGDYVEFAHMMEKYLWPRWTGIHKLDTYIEGYENYLNDRGISGISMEAFSGNRTYEEAASVLINQIDAGYPVPNLVLNHKSRALKDYVWHWFIINGYERAEDAAGESADYDDMRAKAVTYSSYEWLDFRELWESGYESSGGLVLYSLEA